MNLFSFSFCAEKFFYSASIKWVCWQTSSRKSNSDGGCVISLSDHSEHRVGTASSNLSRNHHSVESSSNRSFCHQCTHNLKTYVSPIQDPKSLAVDTMTLSWKGVFNYIVPLLSSSQDPEQNSHGRFQDHFYCASSAKIVVVTTSSEPFLCKPFGAFFTDRPSFSVQSNKTSSGSGETSSSSFTVLEYLKANLSGQSLFSAMNRLISVFISRIAASFHFNSLHY